MRPEVVSAAVAALGLGSKLNGKQVDGLVGVMLDSESYPEGVGQILGTQTLTEDVVDRIVTAITEPDAVSPAEMEGASKAKKLERDREGYVLDSALDPGSLVGSWFLVFDGNETPMQGIVVGEPQPGTYLCELHSFVDSLAMYQRIFTMRRMCEHDTEEWRFFDSDKLLREYFARTQGEVSV